MNVDRNLDEMLQQFPVKILNVVKIRSTSTKETKSKMRQSQAKVDKDTR